MSLINKMLKDLDARGGQPSAATASPEIRPVPPRQPRFPWMRVSLVGALVALLGASAYLAWRMTQDVAQAPPAEVPVSIASGSSPAVPAAPPAPAAGPVAPAPAPVLAEASAESAPEPAIAAAAPAASAPAADLEDTPRALTGKRKPDGASGNAAQALPRKEPAGAKPAARAPSATSQPKPKHAVAAATVGGRSETSAQRADNGYRRALASLEDGRVTEAIAHLQEALRVNPRHEASRQTLVSLLIEAKRPEEAIRQLGASLALDPAQPAMAMLLARLQLERGSPGIDTLMRTLPHAGGNADYRAFLAGALQREERHREAVDHYLAALRLNPQNGVWWMGLGISLQVEKRHPEAATAFQKALDSGSLTPELRGFVERKLKQLPR